MGQVAENVKSVLTESLEASANIAAYQWHGMKMTANGEVTVCAGETDIPIGILTNDPDADGKPAQILVVGRCPVVAGETITYGDLIRIDSNGHAMIFSAPTDTTCYQVGRCIRGALITEMAVCEINCCSPVKGVAA